MNEVPNKIERLIAETKTEVARWMDAQDGDRADNEVEGLKVALFIAMKSMPEDFSKEDFTVVITMLIGTYEAEAELPEILCSCIHTLSKTSPRAHA